MLGNRQLTLSVIAVLALIKFLLLPLFSWQNEMLNSINKQNSQLVKGLYLLENQAELTNQLQGLKQVNSKQLQLIASSESSSIAYQLNVQKKVERLLEKYQLTSRSANWLNVIERGSVEEQRLEISLRGSVKQFIEFISEVEQQSPKLALIEYRTAINNMYPNRHELGRFSGKFILVGWRNVAGVKDE